MKGSTSTDRTLSEILDTVFEDGVYDYEVFVIVVCQGELTIEWRY